jgi:hypothetical protein
MPLELFPSTLLDATRFLLVPVVGFAFVLDALTKREEGHRVHAFVTVLKLILLFGLLGSGAVLLRQATEATPVPRGALATRVRPQTLLSIGSTTLFISEIEGLQLRGVAVYDPSVSPGFTFVDEATYDPFRERILINDLEAEFPLSGATDGFLEVLSPGPVLGFLSQTFRDFLDLTDGLMDEGLVLYLMHLAGIATVLFAAWLIARHGSWPLTGLSFSVLVVVFLPAVAVFLSEAARHPLVGTVFTRNAEPFLGSVGLILFGLLIAIPAWIRAMLEKSDAGRRTRA